MTQTEQDALNQYETDTTAGGSTPVPAIGRQHDEHYVLVWTVGAEVLLAAYRVENGKLVSDQVGEYDLRYNGGAQVERVIGLRQAFFRALDLASQGRALDVVELRPVDGSGPAATVKA